MSYRTIHINTAAPVSPETSLLVIYAGGTLGMSYAPTGQHLVPLDFERVLEEVPELARYRLSLTLISVDRPIDSANTGPEEWIAFASLIREHYEDFAGFVILHGTDTMAYTASALSFLLENLNKPVVLTGAQLPVGAARTDARSNLISSLEIAAARELGSPVVPEVCIFFGNRLMRGNRTRKLESGHFVAFDSRNYPLLAMAGVQLEFNKYAIRSGGAVSRLRVHERLDPRVATLRLFPGMQPVVLESMLRIPGLRALVVETYGSGNAPTVPWFSGMLREAIEAGIIVYNVTQCIGGRVMQGRYETSRHLKEIGVLSGADITLEAAVTKAMYLLASDATPAEVRVQLERPLRGEMR